MNGKGITGRGLLLERKEGGQYRRRRSDKGEITPRLFDKASRIIFVYVYFKLYTMQMWIHTHTS